MEERLLFGDLKIDHLAFLCKDLKQSTYLNLYLLLSWEIFHKEDIISEQTSVILLKSKLENFYIELIAPLNENSLLCKTLLKRGEGFHHICYKVINLDAKIEQLRNKNVHPLPKYPRMGSRNKKICFLDPKNTGGILV